MSFLSASTCFRTFPAVIAVLGFLRKSFLSFWLSKSTIILGGALFSPTFAFGAIALRAVNFNSFSGAACVPVYVCVCMVL